MDRSLVSSVRTNVQAKSPPQRAGRRVITLFLARAAAAALLGFMATCEGLDNIEVPVTGKAVIPAATLVGQILVALELGGFQSIDISNELENQGVTKDDVDSVHIKSFTLTTGSNFDFLTSVSFFVETDGAPQVLVAKIDQVPKGATVLTLDVEEGVELKPYVVAPRMRIRGKVEGKQPDEETAVGAEVLLDVDVTVPGC